MAGAPVEAPPQNLVRRLLQRGLQRKRKREEATWEEVEEAHRSPATQLHVTCWGARGLGAVEAIAEAARQPKLQREALRAFLDGREATDPRVRLHSSLYAFRVEEAAAGQHWDTAFQSWAIEALAGAPCILSLAQPPLLVLLQGGDPATEELTAHALEVPPQLLLTLQRQRVPHSEPRAAVAEPSASPADVHLERRARVFRGRSAVFGLLDATRAFVIDAAQAFVIDAAPALASTQAFANAGVPVPAVHSVTEKVTTKDGAASTVELGGLFFAPQVWEFARALAELTDGEVRATSPGVPPSTVSMAFSRGADGVVRWRFRGLGGR